MTGILCGATSADFAIMLDELHTEFLHLLLQFNCRERAGFPAHVKLPLLILPEGYFIGKGGFIRVNISNVSDCYFRG